MMSALHRLNYHVVVLSRQVNAEALGTATSDAHVAGSTFTSTDLLWSHHGEGRPMCQMPF